MNLIVLTAIGIFALPVFGIARQQENRSVCPGGESPDDDVLLTICDHARGMVQRPQPRLYLRVYTDGRGEIERTAPGSPDNAYREQTLIKETFHVDVGEINEIRRLGRMADFQQAKDVYPAYVIATDSSLTTKLVLTDQGKTKKIAITNFSYGSADNRKHYGLSFCRLMARAYELRDRGLGIVREPPTLSFCELMRDREYYAGFVIAVNAILDYGGTQPVLYDPACAKRAPFTTEKIGVGFDFKVGKSMVLQDQARSVREPRFGARARVYVYGILLNDRARSNDADNFRFYISELKTIDPIVLPYDGHLEAGWMYVDSFDAKGDELKFSSPPKPLAHHAVRVEWVNADKYPLLRAAGRTFITFRVISRDTQKMGSNRWNDTYTCEILDSQ